MPEPTLVLSGLLSIAVGLVYYILVGRAAGHRDLAPDPRVAMRLFQTWWFCIGGSTSLLGVNTVLAAFGVAPLAYHVIFYYALLAAVITGLFGLSYFTDDWSSKTRVVHGFWKAAWAAGSVKYRRA